MPSVINAAPSTPSPRPKRGRRFWLTFLAVVLFLLVVVGLPVRTDRSNHLLKESVLSNDSDGAHFALANGADPDLAMRTATAIDLLNLVLRRSPRPPAPDVETALIVAAKKGNAKIIADLLQHGAKVNTRLENGYSALLYTASKPSPEMLAALIARGADLHVQNRMGTTPLLFAVQAGQKKNVALLLEKGEDVHEADRQSRTALSLGVESGQEEIVRMLLAAGANASDLRGALPAPVGITRVSGFAPTSGQVSPLPPPKGVRQWPPIPKSVTGPKRATQFPSLSSRSNTTTPAPSPIPPLSFAAKSGSLTLMKYLLEGSATPLNPQEDLRSGYAPLGYAAATPDPEISRQLTALLIAHGADINAADTYGRSPLLAATAVANHRETVRLLIAHGANVRAVERYSGRTPLMDVADVEVARLLLAHGADVNAHDNQGGTALMRCRSAQVAALLIAHGADVNARDNQGNTALTKATDAQIASVLITHGVNVNLRDKYDSTILMKTTDPQIATVLIAHGADVNARNKFGNTALSLTNSASCSEVLIAHGADVNIRDNRGNTPLLSAVRSQNTAKVTVLLQHGARLDIVNNQGETPLFAAQATRFAPLIALLTGATGKR